MQHSYASPDVLPLQVFPADFSRVGIVLRSRGLLYVVSFAKNEKQFKKKDASLQWARCFKTFDMMAVPFDVGRDYAACSAPHASGYKLKQSNAKEMDFLQERLADRFKRREK